MSVNISEFIGVEVTMAGYPPILFSARNAPAVLGGGGPVVPPTPFTRNFLTFDPIAQLYVDLSSSVTLTTDFDIDVDFYINVLTTFNMLLSSGSDSSEYIGVTPSGRLRFALNGVFNDMGAVSTNEFHELRISRRGSDITGTLDGVDLTGFSDNSNVIISDIGSRQISTQLFFDGVISNLFVSDIGTPVIDMPINDTFISSQAVNNRVLGGVTGTLVNGTSADSEAFTQVSDGWEGTELWVDGGTGAIPPLGAVIGSTQLVTGFSYRFGDTSTPNIRANDATGFVVQPNTDFIMGSGTTLTRVRNQSSVETAPSFTPSFKRILEDA